MGTRTASRTSRAAPLAEAKVATTATVAVEDTTSVLLRADMAVIVVVATVAMVRIR